MLQAKNLTKLYKLQETVVNILINANFNIEPEEFIFLTGFSGSGKTTLIRMIAGEEKPTYGTIYFRDRDIFQLTDKAYLEYKRHVTVIYQDYKLIPHKTVAQNIEFVLEVLGYDDLRIKDITSKALEIVGLLEKAHLYPDLLSGGEKRRVAIARAIAVNPVILLADEPTGDLDPQNAGIIMEIFKTISKTGTSVLMATHSIDLISNITDPKIWFLDNGRLHQNIDLTELTKRYMKQHIGPVDSSRASNILNLSQLPEDLQVKVKKIPSPILENIQDLTPQILLDFYGLKPKEIKLIIKAYRL